MCRHRLVSLVIVWSLSRHCHIIFSLSFYCFLVVFVLALVFLLFCHCSVIFITKNVSSLSRQLLFIISSWSSYCLFVVFVSSGSSLDLRDALLSPTRRLRAASPPTRHASGTAGEFGKFAWKSPVICNVTRSVLSDFAVNCA